MQTILTLTNLTKKFGSLTAVDNLSLKINKGFVYGILGPNGSGKSTTLGMLLNIVNKTDGSYHWFDGTETTHSALKKVGAIIERPNFYPYMTAKQNLDLVCKIKNVTNYKINEKLEIVDLLDRSNHKFSTFSLGMKQRLAIASALLNEPEILILDEPTNGLDPKGIHQIREIIKKIAANGTTILLASHLLDEVEKVCTHVVILRKGKSLYSGSVENMIASHGFFTLQSEDLDLLKKVLDEHPSVGDIMIEGTQLIAYLKEPLSGSKLNRILFEQGINLSYLVHRKESLEEQFLELTKSN
ncbi:MAG: ABC transporter ATP-binding protein [Flavobacteriales bacterium]|nr:MAG: ABC transporter ATP-binding protein [Flavobacteriales bacterium]